MQQKSSSSTCSLSRRSLIKWGAATAGFGPLAVRADNVEVALAGMAYAGDSASLDARFPYSRGYQAALKAAAKYPNRLLMAAIAQSPPDKLTIVERVDQLKGRDQAIAVALVIGSETISVERIAGLNKLFVLVRAQAMFFDFKSLSVVRAYPISFAQIDVFDRPPTQAEIAERVRGVYEGAGGKPGIFARFGSAVTKASLPTSTSRYLGVSKIRILPEALANIPAYLTTGANVAETWAADLVGEALSTRTGVPIVPYSKGYAIGNVMSVAIADGDVYNLKLPPPDYEIGVELSALRKIKYGASAAGESFIYGSYAAVRIEEPVSGKVYLDSALKNGEIKLVPVTQTGTDDFPAFYDSINGLFVKLSEALDGRGTTWLKTAAAASDIERQVATTRELIKLCK